MKLTKRNGFLIYLTAFLCIAVLNTVFNTVQYRSLLNWVFLPIFLFLFAASLRKTLPLLKSGPLAPAGNGQLDRVKKRIINLTYLLIYLLAILFVNLVIAILSTPARADEVLTAIRPSMQWLFTALFFWLGAVMVLLTICPRDQLRACIAYDRKQALISSAAWILYLTLGTIAGLPFLYGSFAAASAVYLIYVLLCNFTLRKSIVAVNFTWKKRYTIAIVSVVLATSLVAYMQRDTYYLQGYINQLPRLSQNTVPIVYREEDGVYELYMEDEEFKILQLTDIHLGGSISSYLKDRCALEAVYAEIAYTKPDLVIVTGDMTFPLGIMSMSLNNSSSVSQFAAFMRNLNIPWAFTFGNHDTEIIASLDQEGLCQLYESLSFKTSGTLLYPYVQPDITGRNNQLIELYNSDGSLNQALFLIDSNAYTGEGINDYDYIHDDQVQWYEQKVRRLEDVSGRAVPSMAFFHIPLQEYREAYELYLAGSDEVRYYFGSNDEKPEGKVCCSDYPSAIFDKMVALGSTKALFCGHDHYNNMSLEYQGIRLTYGMSIDYLAMPGIEKSQKQRGGTLITIYEDSSFDIQQIPLTSIAQ